VYVCVCVCCVVDAFDEATSEEGSYNGDTAEWWHDPGEGRLGS